LCDGTLSRQETVCARDLDSQAQELRRQLGLLRLPPRPIVALLPMLYLPWLHDVAGFGFPAGEYGVFG
jgi:hypothetical protein